MVAWRVESHGWPICIELRQAKVAMSAMPNKTGRGNHSD
jgi:hypothetical protein